MPNPDSSFPPAKKEKNIYRPDIDGLRAIAVVAVLLYHAQIPFFEGGFVGVDIFFVISGFLITQILLREIENREFSLARFYERRIRRIFPLLFTVLAATTLFSFLFFDAKELKDFSQSLFATTLFSSNIHFWQQSGYFDGASELKPLLHTWSLAVEEQFYIFYPVLLWLCFRVFRKRLGLIFILAALASFAISLYFLKIDPSGAFYLTHFRIWELLIGGFLALGVIPSLQNRQLNSILSLVGMALLIYPIFVYSNQTAFPGAAALLPTVGAAIVIYSGTRHETSIHRFLHLKPIVYLGKISYSLYMWHWPGLVFARYYAIRPLKPFEMLGLFGLIVLVSSISWKWIETPIRQGIHIQPRRVFASAALAMVAASALAVSLTVNEGLPGRFQGKTLIADAEWDRWGTCNLDHTYATNPLDLCEIGQAGGEPTFIIWGDSHGRAMAPAIQASAEQHGKSGVTAYTNGCPPLIGIDREGYALPCSEINKVVLDYIRSHANLTTVLLISKWPAYTAETATENIQKGSSRMVLIDSLLGRKSEGQNAAFFQVGLDRTLHELHQTNRQVVIVTAVPKIGFDVASVFAIAQRTGRNLNEMAPSKEDYLSINKTVNDLFAHVRGNQSATLVEPWKELCRSGRCMVRDQGQLLYHDSGHLSSFGAMTLTSLFDPIFKNNVSSK